MKYIRPSCLALAALAATLAADPANACCGGGGPAMAPVGPPPSVGGSVPKGPTNIVIPRPPEVRVTPGSGGGGGSGEWSGGGRGRSGGDGGGRTATRSGGDDSSSRSTGSSGSDKSSVDNSPGNGSKAATDDHSDHSTHWESPFSKVVHGLTWPVKIVGGWVLNKIQPGAGVVNQVLDAPANYEKIRGTLEDHRGEQAQHDAQSYIWNKTQLQPNVDQRGGVFQNKGLNDPSLVGQ